MSRIRTIKPEFFRHYELWLAEHETGLPLRVAFAGLWCVADREGRFPWIPPQLKIETLPYDDVEFSRVLDALATCGFVEKYRVGERDFGVIPAFKKHQAINNRERDSELPKPPDDAVLTRVARVRDALTTREAHVAQGKEGKGKEQDKPRGNGDSLFPEFWAAYPVHKAKETARRAWNRIQPDRELLKLILAAVEAQKRERGALRAAGKFVPEWKHPATWLNASCWEDEVAKPSEDPGDSVAERELRRLEAAP